MTRYAETWSNCLNVNAGYQDRFDSQPRPTFCRKALWQVFNSFYFYMVIICLFRVIEPFKNSGSNFFRNFFFRKKRLFFAVLTQKVNSFDWNKSENINNQFRFIFQLSSTLCASSPQGFLAKTFCSFVRKFCINDTIAVKVVISCGHCWKLYLVMKLIEYR